MAGHTFKLCIVVLVALYVQVVDAHIAAWAPGMYCRYGRAGQRNPNNDLPVAPIYGQRYSDWWFHRSRGCDTSPPPAGEFLELPAGGNFTVEFAGNLAFTSMRPAPRPPLGLFGDGRIHDLPYDVANGAPTTVDGCIASPNLHTKNEAGVSGSAFAISYASSQAQVTRDNLVVFSVRHHTPFYRLASFDVPADMPACPPGGCHCAWLWIADGCGQDNMFMNWHKCMVTGATSVKTISAPRNPTYCKDDPTTCVTGAKKMVAWQQISGNNYIRRPGQDRPGYNAKLGFLDGAQNDIFEDASPGTPVSDPTASPTQEPQEEIGSIAAALMSMVPPMSASARKRRFLVFQ